MSDDHDGGGKHIPWELDEDDIPKVAFGATEGMKLADMIDEIQNLDTDIAALDEKRAELAARRQQLAERDVPLLFAQCNMRMFKLADGTKVEVKKDLKAGLVKEPVRRAMQIAWLDNHGLSAIVKRQLIGRVPREQVELLAKGTAALKALGIGEVDTVFDVHNGTLVSNLKALREQGVELPTSPIKLFGHYELRSTKIVRPR